MNEMVERVARAICGVAEQGFDPRLEPRLFRFYEAHAIAAIAAMREPTEAMIDAAIYWTPSPYEISAEDRAAYEVMIRSILDAALKD